MEVEEGVKAREKNHVYFYIETLIGIGGCDWLIA